MKFEYISDYLMNRCPKLTLVELRRLREELEEIGSVEIDIIYDQMEEDLEIISGWLVLSCWYHSLFSWNWCKYSIDVSFAEWKLHKRLRFLVYLSIVLKRERNFYKKKNSLIMIEKKFWFFFTPKKSFRIKMSKDWRKLFRF